MERAREFSFENGLYAVLLLGILLSALIAVDRAGPDYWSRSLRDSERVYYQFGILTRAMFEP